MKLFSIFSLLIVLHYKAEAQTSALQIADDLYTSEYYSKAIESYQKINPKTNYVYWQLAKSHRAKGTYSNALSFYKKAATSDSTNNKLLLEYAGLLITTQKISLADSIYHKLVERHPDNPNFHYRLGLAKKTQKDSTAILYFKKAFKLDSTHQKSCYEVARHYLKKGQFRSAEKVARIGLTSYTENPRLLSILAQKYLLQEYYDQAIPYFEKIVELNQGNAYVYTSLGFCYDKNYNYKKAIKHYTRVLEYNQEDIELHTNLANVYQKSEKYQKALNHLLIVLELKNKPIENDLLKVAACYSAQKKGKKAFTYTQLAIKENPDFEMGYYQLAMYADKYYKDPKVKLKYYHKYLTKFENKEPNKYLQQKIQKRAKQLEIELKKIILQK